MMDHGGAIIVLAFVSLIVGAWALVPDDWRRTAGGLLIILTLVIMAAQTVELLVR